VEVDLVAGAVRGGGGPELGLCGAMRSVELEVEPVRSVEVDLVAGAERSVEVEAVELGRCGRRSDSVRD
jgi:hypothetical protein